MKTLRYAVEAFFLILLLLFFRLLPLDAASWLGGRIMRSLGPWLKVHKVAQNNLKRALPEKDALEVNRILTRMWDNLGRVIGEYPHLSRPLMKQRITLEGLEHLEVIKQSRQGSFFVSGHFANWEIGPLASALYGLPLAVVYRAPNNPFADWVIRTMRRSFSRAMYKKGRAGAQSILKSIKQGEAVGVLVDQKMNEGKPISFLGQTAMTATATTAIAIKQQVPLLLARVMRTKGAHFVVTLQPPVLYPPATDSTQAMEELHTVFETWIKDQPAQWFWVHKRWG